MPKNSNDMVQGFDEVGHVGKERLRLAVIIPTFRRPSVLAQAIQRIADQTRQPDTVVVVGTNASDFSHTTQISSGTKFIITEKGLCRQRNHGIDAVRNYADVVVFLDDDFVMASDYLKNVEEFFLENKEVGGVTGYVLADGAKGSEIDISLAMDLIKAADASPASHSHIKDTLYGCNMAYSVNHVRGLKFDEALPLYGWQEDVDFSYRLGLNSPLYKVGSLRGVHLGVRSGRSPGVPMGYSQIANPVYLLKKHSIPRKMAYRLMMRNFAANLAGSFVRDPIVDRKGRLRGNLRAFADLLIGRLRPDRILDISR